MKRAYGSEPVLLDASPITTALSVPKPRRKRRWIAGCVFIGFFFLLAVLLVVLWSRSDNSSILPATVRQSVDYPLYGPVWLPDGARIDSESVDATPQVVTFTVLYDGEKKLIFTEQLKPAEFDFDNFYDDQLTDKRTFNTAIGRATIGLFEGSNFASIIAGQTWIIIRAPMGIDSMTFDHIIRDLRLDS